MCVNKVTCLRMRVTVSILQLSNNILAQYGMHSIRTSLETSAPFLSTIILTQTVSYCGSSSKWTISKMLYCYFNPVLLFFFPLLGTFSHSLFSHCAEHFSGMRLQQSFYFSGKIGGRQIKAWCLKNRNNYCSSRLIKVVCLCIFFQHQMWRWQLFTHGSNCICSHHNHIIKEKRSNWYFYNSSVSNDNVKGVTCDRALAVGRFSH